MQKKIVSIAFMLALNSYTSLLHAEGQAAPATQPVSPAAEQPASAPAPQANPAENSTTATPATPSISAEPAAATAAPATEEQDGLSLLRASMRIEKREFIKTAMGLNDKEAEKFWSLYYQYEAALMKLNDRKLQLIKDYATDFNTLTEDKASKLAKNAFEIHKARTALLETYYKKIAKAVSYKVAARFAQIENVFNSALDVKIGASIPLMPKQ